MLATPNISIAQSDFRNGDLSYNIGKMNKLARDCREQTPDASLLIFPELSVSGYFLSPDLKELAEFQKGSSFARMSEIAEHHKMWILYGYPEKDREGKVYNSIQLIDSRGESVANYRKIHLTPGEKELFTPGSEPVMVETELGNIGLLICWDLAFPELARTLALKGADLLLAPSAWESPYEAPFYQFGASRAIDNTVYVAACNHTGISKDLSFFGKSAIFAPDGTNLAICKEKKEHIITAALDYSWRNHIKETFFTMLSDRRPDVYRRGEEKNEY